jgi:deoxyribodipyrimidine photo-lyase
MSQSVALVWFRRDLRLADQPALLAAAAACDVLVPVFVHAPEEETPWRPGAASRWWLHHSLLALEESLRRFGMRLIVRRGPTLPTLLALARQTGARAVFWNRAYEPALIARDTKLKKELLAAGIRAESFNGSLLREPWEVLRNDAAPYKVFTAYWKAGRALAPPAAPDGIPRLAPPGTWPESEPITALELLPRLRWDAGLATAWKPGERSAQRRLDHFADRILPGYARSRDLPGEDGVSRLSAHLHFGEVSPRQIWHTVQGAALAAGAERQADACLRQLAWRDFAYHLLFYFPHTPEQPFRPEFERFPWQARNRRLWHAWTRGQTGIPLVDAGMRELWATGWMHNRVRMNVASWLTKNAGVHWLEGARWFWDTLVDADLANNTLGWQWTAGCGADAAPYFRIFNPVLQGRRYDPGGAYIRRWVSEIAALPDEYIHAPWSAPASVLGAARVSVGRDYPLPVLDLVRTRASALAAFRTLRGPRPTES